MSCYLNIILKKPFIGPEIQFLGVIFGPLKNSFGSIVVKVTKMFVKQISSRKYARKKFIFWSSLDSQAFWISGPKTIFTRNFCPPCRCIVTVSMLFSL